MQQLVNKVAIAPSRKATLECKRTFDTLTSSKAWTFLWKSRPNLMLHELLRLHLLARQGRLLCKLLYLQTEKNGDHHPNVQPYWTLPVLKTFLLAHAKYTLFNTQTAVSARTHRVLQCQFFFGSSEVDWQKPPFFRRTPYLRWASVQSSVSFAVFANCSWGESTSRHKN